MISPTTMTTAAGASAPETAAARPADLITDPLAQKETFLKLLVAQIKNQDPMNPADGIEFLSQLAQFSQLEQTLNIRSELETIRRSLTEKPEAKPAEPGTDAAKGA